jgi:hypothetical protein
VKPPCGVPELGHLALTWASMRLAGDEAEDGSAFGPLPGEVGHGFVGPGGGAGGCDGVVVRCSAGQTRRGSTVGGVHRHSREGFGAGSSRLRSPRWHGPSQARQSGERAGSRLARTLSVPVRGFTCPARRAHGHMTDRTGREGRYQLENTRSDGIWPHQAKRSVKPSAQPTLVRTQHLPPPAKTARELGCSWLGGPSCLCHRVSSSVRRRRCAAVVTDI